MQRNTQWSIFLLLALLIGMLVMTACGPSTSQQPAATATITQNTEQNAAATLPPAPTATTAPTNTEAPTATPTLPVPTATPEPSATTQLGLTQENGISGWCLPEQVLISAASDPLSPPPAAQIGKIVDNQLDIRNMPFSVCVFLYTFNQPAPTGLKLEIYDLNQKTAWWKADLTPVNGKANIVYTNLRHTYIVNPPLWNVSYEFVVRDANGTELHRDQVNLHRWTTGLCWQGTLPDPVTLYCPLQQDLHPWDPGYGKKLPTVTPKPD